MENLLVLLSGKNLDDAVPRLANLFPDVQFLDGREGSVYARHFHEATIMVGVPPVDRLAEAKKLKWVQLWTAGVPRKFREPAREQGLLVTNLAGLFGPSIAEHVLCLMMMLSRHLHTAMRHQFQKDWREDLHKLSRNIRGQTLGIIGLGNIGRCTAQLAKAHGMRVVGTRRDPKETPFVDQVYPLAELTNMLAEIDVLAIAAPLTTDTEGLIGEKELAAMKQGVLLVNVGRGAIVQEGPLLEALKSGHIAGAAFDVFHKEPLPKEHPFWTMPQVIISPHYSGDNIYETSLPIDRFARNLRLWIAGKPLENIVDLERGY